MTVSTKSKNRTFKTRAEWLAFCKHERERLQRERRAWVQLLREPVLPKLVSPGGLKMSAEQMRQNRTHLQPVGAVAIWEADGKTFVGASRCNPREQHKFDRHEAVYRALRTSPRTSLRRHNGAVEVPPDLDLTATTDVPHRVPFNEVTEEMFTRCIFYGALPRSARELVRSMLLSLRKHKQRPTA